MKKILPVLTAPTVILTGFFVFLLLGGCMHTGTDTPATDSGHEVTAAESRIENEPYYPADFRDLLIPGELVWNREKSVSINTDSFSGGILNFDGRVEVNSLTEFFITSMKKDGWTMNGTVKSKNVLLAFVKDTGSCMIRIFDGGTLGKTDVYVYITHRTI